LPTRGIEDTPTPRLPRVLKNVRDVRRELVSLYKQTKRGVVEPQLAGRLVYILSAITAIDNGIGLQDRLAEVEATLAGIKPNGHDRRSRVGL
jgi:hypothetical protein